MLRRVTRPWLSGDASLRTCETLGPPWVLRKTPWRLIPCTRFPRVKINTASELRTLWQTAVCCEAGLD